MWLTVTKKLEVSQELIVSPSAMPLSLNDFVASVMTYKAPAIQHSTNVQNLYLMLCHVICCHICTASLFPFDNYLFQVDLH